ncbi:hypothetical protein MKQ70_28310 [Chitinophaga sedimenti]|nr:glutamate synthase central domain-containing protein [Chitinophaga sedimenti]MCK7558683.1 hypothetical protein [Chitinophaga sedimenti]
MGSASLCSAAGLRRNCHQPIPALSTIRDMRLTGKLQTDLDVDKLKKNYVKAVCDGLLKVFSKMGISTLQSYQGAQILKYSVLINL